MVSGPVWLSLHLSVPPVTLLKPKQLGVLPPSQLGLGGSVKGTLAHSSRAASLGGLALLGLGPWSLFPQGPSALSRPLLVAKQGPL